MNDCICVLISFYIWSRKLQLFGFIEDDYEWGIFVIAPYLAVLAAILFMSWMVTSFHCSLIQKLHTSISILSPVEFSLVEFLGIKFSFYPYVYSRFGVKIIPWIKMGFLCGKASKIDFIIIMTGLLERNVKHVSVFSGIRWYSF